MHNFSINQRFKKIKYFDSFDLEKKFYTQTDRQTYIWAYRSNLPLLKYTKKSYLIDIVWALIEILYSGSYPSSLVTVQSPQYAILGQTVQLYCNFTLPPGNNNFYSLKVGWERKRFYPNPFFHQQSFFFFIRISEIQSRF